MVFFVKLFCMIANRNIHQFFVIFSLPLKLELLAYTQFTLKIVKQVETDLQSALSYFVIPVDNNVFGFEKSIYIYASP